MKAFKNMSDISYLYALISSIFLLLLCSVALDKQLVLFKLKLSSQTLNLLVSWIHNSPFVASHTLPPHYGDVQE